MSQSSETIPMFATTPPILLVEDNLVNQKVALILLERLGLKTQLATNGEEAVTAVQKDKYALILMDCHMPKMDGFEAAVAIRKMEEITGGYTPIIAVTALAMAGDRERCIAAGMDDYISKPIDKNILQVKINHWLRTDVVYQNHKLRRKYLRPNAHIMLLDGAPIDLAELEEFYGVDQLNQVLQTFLANTEDMIQRLQSAMFERRDRPIAGLAHELKASCVSIGAKQLARLCLYLEQAVGQQDWLEAKETVISLERSFGMLKNYVESSLELEEEPSVS